MLFRYQISTLVPYINWTYFFYAWKVSAESDEGKKLYTDAVALLNRFDRFFYARAVVRLCRCNSDGDDIVLVHPSDCPCCSKTPKVIERLPMLRQQHVSTDGFCWCLSDFIRPVTSGVPDVIGLFATSVDSDMQNQYDKDDPYGKMMVQTLSDRIAEAAAECLHEEVRKNLWGYASDEKLTIEEMHQEKFVGIRPAVGYPCLPDISLNFILERLLDFPAIGVSLTDSGMMRPHASVSGLMIRHPESRYFSVGKIDQTQLEDYSRRRGLSVDVMRKFLEGNML